ncbi:HAD domain-containing protein [Actinokineospora alba]|uniref:hypothetical protein n=1 Tax=Actinokineospora alba TaxID=504798 RepID=UPI0010618DB0|nr:hypothetical protein [Actinokineospora alba]TDP66876.1 hypothetical protein C8E96_2393 [Actinokineospora alba]
MVRPLVLLDVDGPLNPFAGSAETRVGFVEHRIRLSRWNKRKVLRLWLNPALGPALLGLAERTGAQLAWATTWGHRANTVIGPAICLPVLRVVELDDSGGRWKFPAVERFAAGRPLVWLDGDFDFYPAERDAFLGRRVGVPTELWRVDPRVGLNTDDVATVEAWLGGHSNVGTAK